MSGRKKSVTRQKSGGRQKANKTVSSQNTRSKKVLYNYSPIKMIPVPTGRSSEYGRRSVTGQARGRYLGSISESQPILGKGDYITIHFYRVEHNGKFVKERKSYVSGLHGRHVVYIPRSHLPQAIIEAIKEQRIPEVGYGEIDK